MPEGEVVTGPSLLRAGLILLGVVGLVLLLVRLQELVIVFVIAVVLAEGLRPLVGELTRRGLHFELARASVYVTLIAALVVVGIVLTRPVVAQSRAVLADLPGYEQRLQSNLAPVLDALSIDTSVGSQLSGYLGSVAAGLGMLLALERRDTMGRVLGCVLLALSIASSSVGIPFAGVALVEVVLRRPGPWYRWWKHSPLSRLCCCSITMSTWLPREPRSSGPCWSGCRHSPVW